MKFQPAWVYYNYRTKKDDYLKDTPKDFRDYISQDAGAQAMYKLHQNLGLSPSEAAIKVMDAQIGETNE